MRHFSALLFLVCITLCNRASADQTGDIIKNVYRACRASDNIDACKIMNEQMKKVKDGVNDTLEELGLKKSATIAAAATGLIIQQRIRLRGKELPLIHNDTSFVDIRKDEVQLGLSWSFQ